MKKVVAGLAVTFLLSLAALASDVTTMTGWVNDAKCAAGGAKPNAACVKKCAEAGEKLVFVDDKMQKVLQVSNQDALMSHAGEHVQLQAKKTSDGSLEVSDVKTIAETKGGEMHDHGDAKK